VAEITKKKEGTVKKPLLLNEVRVEKLKLTARSLTDITYQIFKNPMGALGIAILVVFVVLAAIGPVIAPYDTSNLGLGKWQLPSDFLTDPPQFVPLLVPAFALIAGLATSSLALNGAFARRPEWNKPNKLIQVAALGLSVAVLALLLADYLFGQFEGPYPVPNWVYPVSMLVPSLALLSLATRRRVSKKRIRLRIAGVVLALIPVAILSLPAVVTITEDSMDVFFLAGYGVSAFMFAISGALLSKAYLKPQVALLKYEKRTEKKHRLPVRVSTIAKATGIILCCMVMISGVLGYLSENWTLHWMGTDSFGADIFSKLLYGARTSMIVGIFSAIIASVLGAIVGLYSGYVGGRVDEVIMRANDVVLSIPWLVLMIIVAAMMGEITLTGIILIIGLTGWSPTARMVRAQVLSIRERQYIERARAIGASDLGIIRRHVLPNSFPLVFANTILTVAVSILSESVLSFLGMRPVGTTTWGTMLDYASSANAFSIGLHWWIIAPGMCIVLVVLGFTLLGYALDDILNPKLRKR
jgi:peptide/nickel transport system permease protein